MALSRRPSPAPAATVAAAATPTPAPAETVPAVSTPPPSSELAVFGMSPLSSAGALALVEAAEEGGGSTFLFPTAEVTGGASGGNFKVLTTGEASDKMPDSRKGIPGVLLAYRLSIVSWPVGYDEKSEEKAKPAWTVAIPASNAGLFRLATRACKNYQFTKSELREKFDMDKSEVGHMQPQLEVLVWQPDVDGLAVVRSAKGFAAIQESVNALTKLADPATGALQPVPCLVKPKTQEESSKSRSWKVHSLDFVPMLTEDGAGVFKSFQAWYAAAKDNEQTVADFKTWTECKDAEPTPTIEKRLTDGASI